jgi:hypothetical protein
MPLGSFRLNGLAKFTVTAVAEVIRAKKGITAVGAQVTTAQSRFSGASLLTGGASTANRITAHNISLSGNVTMECWVRSNGAWPASGDIVFFGWDPVYAFMDTTRSIGMYINGTSEGPTALTTNTWHHLAWVRVNNVWNMYQNGVLQATRSDSSTLTNGTVFMGTHNGTYQFYMDEIRISNLARYTANFTSPTQPFVNDANTLLLIHADGTSASTYFEDDNGQRGSRGITAIGNAQIDTAQSKFGGASALFDGNGDYLNLTTDPAYTFAGDVTVECWYRLPGAVPGIAAFFFNDHLFYLTNDGGVAKYAIFSGGSNRLLTGSIGTISSGVWYHVAFVRSGSTLAVYHNGVQQATSTWSNTMTSQANNYIGFYPGSSFFNGHIDEYRISSSARYTANFTPSTIPFVNDANTLLLLHMDGTDATTVFTDDNGVRSPKGIAAIGNAQVSTAQSKFGGASALFDGSGDWLEIQPISDLAIGTGNFTIEFWVRFNDTGNGILWDTRPISTQGAYTCIYVDLSRIRYYFNNGDRIVSASNYTTGVWYHVAVVRSGSETKMYIDGTQSGSTYTDSSSIIVSSRARIGRESDSDSANVFHNGWIDEFRFSNSARYTANFTPSTTPFVNDANTLLLLHMDGTNASTIFRDDNGVTPTHNYS